jgi:hypothetical protein
MKPYCLTGDKVIRPSTIKNASYEDNKTEEDPVGWVNAKKLREDRKIERRAEKKSARQQAKQKLKKLLP